MRKLAGLFTLILFCIAPALAQETAPAPAPGKTPKKVKAQVYTPKYEISGAFAYRSFYSPAGPNAGGTFGMTGWQGSFVYNLDPWLGVEGEATGTYKDQGLNGKTTVYTGMAGPQFYPFKHHKITPFAHALFGVGYYDLHFPPLSPFPSSSITKSASAWDIGGGVDVYLTEHWGVRAIQLDYDKENVSSQTSRVGYRVSFGVVYRFGSR